MRHVRRFLAFALCLSLLVGLGVVPRAFADTVAHPFEDIRGSRYESVIATLYEMGVVNGLEPNKFVPSGPVTRAQMAALIVRAMGKTDVADQLKSVPSQFKDVPQDHWAMGVIALAHRAEIIKGDGTNFFPNDPVNYAQAVTMLVRALGYESQVTGGYPSGYVLKGNDLHLLDNTNYELYGGVNRAEAAVLLYNAIFKAPTADKNVTWSQSVFKRAKTLQFAALPQYVAPGQQVTLNATVADQEGKPLPDAIVNYRIVAGSGQIRGNVLTAGDGGAIMVQASVGSLTAVATITPVSNLAISPDNFQATKGGTVQFAATAQSGGARVSVTPEWRATGPATITQQGLLTVNDYGNVTVTAVLGNLTASVSGQAVGQVAITSKPEFVVPGLSYDLAATATDSAGRTLNVPITWTAVGGVIDRTTGRLTGVSGNQITVRATAAGVTAEAVIPVIKTLEITPASASVMSGKTVAFTAKGVDATGNKYSNLPVRWDRSNPLVGLIGSDGTFVGINVGTTTVTADLGSLRATAQASVAGNPTRMTLTTSAQTLPLTGTATITVKLLDSAGNLSPVSEQPISLTLTGAGSLSRTLVLTKDGEASVTYTPGASASTVTISATAPGTNLTAQPVVIGTYQSTPAYVQLSATPQQLATGGGLATITASLRDNNGFPATASQTVTVTVTASSFVYGGLTGTTITIPAGQTSGQISFISSGSPGTIVVNGSSSYQVRSATLQTVAVGPAARAKIRPISGVTPVTGLSSLQVQVEVQDAAGVVRANDNTTQVELRVAATSGSNNPAPIVYNATSIAGVATFQVPAFTVGVVNLTANLLNTPGAMSDTATAEFVPGVFSSIRMTATPATLSADGYSQSQVVAEVVDRSGTVLTSINPIITFRKLTDGGATNAISPLTVQAVNGRAVLTVQANRQTGVDTWYATAPGLDTQNLANVTTSNAVGTAYTLKVTGPTTFAVGATNTLIVQVVDQSGTPVTGDTTRIITATYSIPGVTITPQQATSTNGTAVFLVTATTATTGTIMLSTTGLPVPLIQQAVTFGTGTGGGTTNPAAYSLDAQASATSVNWLTPVTIFVRVLDVQGNLLTTDSGRTITGTVTGVGHLVNTSAQTVNGIAQFTVVANSTGFATVTFTTPSNAALQTQMVIIFNN